MDDLVSDFIEETTEILDKLDSALARMAKTPEDQSTRDEAFRLMHTIKGTCGFLDFPKLEETAHQAEDTLESVHNGKLKASAESLAPIYDAMTSIRYIIQSITKTGAEPEKGIKPPIQPIADGWAIMPHIINDLSVKLGKSINLKTRGDDTELDHRVLAKLKAPMVHLVRNACDHGIEAPEIRETANKPATGTVFLEARHEGDNIIVMVCDDGAGLAIDKIKQRAQANNLASAEALEEMSEEEIQSFIFKAGFSTKDEVSKVSGRGVGMDIVRTSLEEIGASVSVRSDNAKGTAFIIKAPRSIS